MKNKFNILKTTWLAVGFLSCQFAHAQFLGGSGDGSDTAISPQGSLGSIFWVGGTSTDWNTASNWLPNTAVPGPTAEIVIQVNGNGNNLVLDQNRTIVSMNFNGANKKVVLGTYTLTITGTAEGSNANNYFQTNSTGTLKNTIANGGNFTFPVGNSAYNPVTVTNNTTTSDVFSVRILDEVYYKGTTGTVAKEPRVQRTWLIDKDNPTANSGSGVNFTFNWNSGEMTAGVNTPRMYHYNGSVWAKQTGSTSSTATSLTYNQYMGSFSPFGIGDDLSVLPVTWLYLRCMQSRSGGATLSWATASENNSKAFEIQRGTNAVDFKAIGELTAAGFSTEPLQYSFTDNYALAGTAYYRIKQVDMDGSEYLSDVCAVSHVTQNAKAFVVYPNPAQSMLYILGADVEKDFTVELFNPTGQLVCRSPGINGKGQLNLNNVYPGLYYVQLKGDGLIQNERILVK